MDNKIFQINSSLSGCPLREETKMNENENGVGKYRYD